MKNKSSLNGHLQKAGHVFTFLLPFVIWYRGKLNIAAP